jgi:methylated-DNA-[protein]-cysteine S-methyltransferase
MHHIFVTDYGFAAIGWNGKGVTAFRLPALGADQAERALLKRQPGSTPVDPPAQVQEVIEAAQRYFAGEAQDFSLVPVDLGEQEPLFLRIYQAVRQLGWGRPPAMARWRANWARRRRWPAWWAKPWRAIRSL